MSIISIRRIRCVTRRLWYNANNYTKAEVIINMTMDILKVILLFVIAEVKHMD